MYYQGDYYRGDYYRGDPFWGALWGGIKKIGGSLLGIGGGKSTTALTKRVTALETVKRATPGIAGGMIGQALMKRFPGAQQRPGTVLERGPIRRGIERALPGGRTGREAEACLSGYHFNKQVSYGRETMGMEAGTFCVRNRRMNVANPRALRRSLRRVCGFGKLAARTRTSIGRAATAVGAGRGRSSRKSCGPRRKCA